MRKLLTLLVALIISEGAGAGPTKQQADAEYAKGNYQEAIRQYEAILGEELSADLYYNLGNAYFKTDELTKAIVNYERALKLAPSDKDIRFNLQFARARTEDKITPVAEPFFVTWYKSMVNAMWSAEWARLSIGAFIFLLIMVGVYLFASKMWMIRAGFYIAVFSGVVWLGALFLSWQQKALIENHDTGVITAGEVKVLKTPKSNNIEFELHEGTTV